LNSPIYQLLCQTLQNKIISDQKERDSTIFATDGGGHFTTKAEKMDPRIHQTNPEYSFTDNARERISNKSAINPYITKSRADNGIELKSKRSSVKNTPSGRRMQNIVVKNPRGPMQNIPLNFMKTFNNGHQGTTTHVVQPNYQYPKNARLTPKGASRQTTTRKTNVGPHNPMTNASKKSNLTSFTNNTLSSALTPNCNVSYSTLKSTNSNSQSKTKGSRQVSLKTANSHKTDNASNNGKFPMNSNFLNLLKKKNIMDTQAQQNTTNGQAGYTNNISNNNISNNSVNCSKIGGPNMQNMSAINRLKEKTSKLVQVTYNNNTNNTNVVQINNYMNNKFGNPTSENSKKIGNGGVVQGMIGILFFG
jgi:hypothetical protein